MDPEQTDRKRHAKPRRRDADDIAAGRRSPGQVNRDNAQIFNQQDWEIRSLSQRTRALLRQR
jgi:hypothetical protein